MSVEPRLEATHMVASSLEVGREVQGAERTAPWVGAS